MYHGRAGRFLCLSVSPAAVCLSVCLAGWLAGCSSACLYFCLSVWLSVCPSVSRSVSLCLLFLSAYHLRPPSEAASPTFPSTSSLDPRCCICFVTG